MQTNSDMSALFTDLHELTILQLLSIKTPA
jgi:hypothetical protein